MPATAIFDICCLPAWWACSLYRVFTRFFSWPSPLIGWSVLGMFALHGQPMGSIGSTPC